MSKLKRAISVDEILKKKFIDMPFEGKWEDSFGIPEMSGVWLVWGESGNGKTSLLLQISKKTSEFGKVAYDTLEEGARKSFKLAIERAEMRSVARRFIILNRESIEELSVRLRQNKSIKTVIIDSIQYADMTKAQYKAFKEEFADERTIIFNSHADGKSPLGALAKFIRYDADVKIRVEGYKAFPISRFGGGKEFIIWEKGAKDYWQEII